MEQATIISNFSNVSSRFREDESLYRSFINRKILLDETIPYFPISFEINSQQHLTKHNINGDSASFDIERLFYETSKNIIIPIDRGFHESGFDFIIELLSKNPECKLIPYTILSPYSQIGLIIKTIREEDQSELNRLKTLKNFMNVLKKKNNHLFAVGGDLTDYKEVLIQEKGNLLNMSYSFENKILKKSLEKK